MMPILLSSLVTQGYLATADVGAGTGLLTGGAVTVEGAAGAPVWLAVACPAVLRTGVSLPFLLLP